MKLKNLKPKTFKPFKLLKKFKNPLIISILILILIGGLYYFQQTSEGFISGAEVQLLTSKPYYTWYDYISHSRRNPYFYNYPYYGKRPYYNRYPYRSPYYSPQYY